MRNVNGSGENVRTSKSQKALMRLYAATAGTVTLFLAGRGAVAQNTPDNFTTGTDLTLATNYANSALPANTNDVTLTSGSLNLTVSNTAALTMGSLDVTNGAAYSITNADTTNNTITLGGGSNNVAGSNASDLIFLSATGSSLTVTNSSTGSVGLVLGASGNFDVATGDTLTLSAPISQAGSAPTSGYNLTYSGGGNIVITGGAAGQLTNTYTGNTTIANANVLVLSSGANVLQGATGGVTTNPFGGPVGTSTPTPTVTLGGNAANTAALTFFNSDTAHSPNIFYEFVAQAGTDSITFENSSPNTHGFSVGDAANGTGGFTLDNNLLITAIGTTAGGGPGGVATATTTVTLDDSISAGTPGLKTLTLNNGGGVYNIGNSDTIPAAQTAITISDGSGQVALILEGSGSFSQRRSNSYTGGTTIEGGTLTFLTDGAAVLNNSLPVGGAVTLAGTGAILADLSIAATTQTVGSLSTSGTGTNNVVTGTTGTLIVGNGGTYGGIITGGMALTLNGGNLALSGSNTYTGATAVNSGATLTLTNSNVPAAVRLGGTAVTVNGGGAMDVAGNVNAGTATTGSVTLAGGATAPAQGTLSLEDGAINTFTLLNATTTGPTLTVGGAAGSPSLVDLDISTTAADEIVDDGPLSIGAGGATINIDTLNAPNPGTYTLISAASLTGAGTLSSFLFSNSTNTETVGSDQYVLTPSGNTETLVVTAVPEPVSASVLAIGAIGLMGRRRRHD